jgi:hypothetical protein
MPGLVYCFGTGRWTRITPPLDEPERPFYAGLMASMSRAQLTAWIEDLRGRLERGEALLA